MYFNVRSKSGYVFCPIAYCEFSHSDKSSNAGYGHFLVGQGREWWGLPFSCLLMHRRGGMASHRPYQAITCSFPKDLPQNEEKKGSLGGLVLGILDLVTALSQLILEVKRP